MKTSVRFAAACLLFGSCTVAALAMTPNSPQTGEPGSMPETRAASQASAKPLPSPVATAETNLNGKAITVHYNSPRMRGRKIMGELVPFGKVWRTGANPATGFVTAGDLKIGDLNVPAGKYTLYTVPQAEGTPWLLIINKQTGQWGLTYNQDQDLGRIPMHYDKLSAPQEDMTISFERSAGKSTQLHIRWETTDVWVKVEAAK